MKLHLQTSEGEAACGAPSSPRILIFPGTAVGIAFAVDRSGVTCPECLEHLRAEVATTPLLERLREVLTRNVGEVESLARTAYLATGALVVADRPEEALVEELDLPGLRIIRAEELARRGILLASGYPLYVTPKAALRLAELAAATREV